MLKFFERVFDRKRYDNDVEYMCVLMMAMNAFRQW